MIKTTKQIDEVCADMYAKCNVAGIPLANLLLDTTMFQSGWEFMCDIKPVSEYMEVSVRLIAPDGMNALSERYRISEIELQYKSDAIERAANECVTRFMYSLIQYGVHGVADAARRITEHKEL